MYRDFKGTGKKIYPNYADFYSSNTFRTIVAKSCIVRGFITNALISISFFGSGSKLLLGVNIYPKFDFVNLQTYDSVVHYF